MINPTPRKPALSVYGQEPSRRLTAQAAYGGSSGIAVQPTGSLAANAFGLLLWLRLKEKRKERKERQERERQRRVYWGYE